MGTRQLRLPAPLTADSVRPLVGRVVQLTLTDGEVRHGRLMSVGPTALELQASPRLANREVGFALVRELIADQDAPR